VKAKGLGQELIAHLKRLGLEGSHRRFECDGKPPLTIPWHQNGNATLHPKIVKDCLGKADLL